MKSMFFSYIIYIYNISHSFTKLNAPKKNVGQNQPYEYEIQFFFRSCFANGGVDFGQEGWMVFPQGGWMICVKANALNCSILVKNI